MRIRRAALGKGYLVGTNWDPTCCAMTRRRAPSHLIDRVLSLKLAVVAQVHCDEAEVGWLAGSRGSMRDG